MENKPLISVIVPCYNQAEYLDECLQSVLDQTFTNWECIIVNDGSPDNTEEIAMHWVAKDARFRYLKKENGGLSSARNAGIKEAKGEWIQFLDCDDILCPNKLASSEMFFDSYDVIITDYFMFEDENIHINKYCLYSEQKINFKSLLFKWDNEFSIPIHASLFKKIYIVRFKENLKAKEDWVFWLEYFHRNNLKTKIIKENLVGYRKNIYSLSHDYTMMQENELCAIEYIYIMLDESLKFDFLKSRILYLYKQLNYERFAKESLNNQLFWRDKNLFKILRSKLWLLVKSLFVKK